MPNLERQKGVTPPESLITPPDPPPTTPPPVEPSLSLGDIQGMVSIITAACERGTFRPTELSAVGSLHDRLVACLKARVPEPK